MKKFYQIYNSIDEFYESFFRGNEVEFIYDSKHFFIIPEYNDEKKVIGVSFGLKNSDAHITLMSRDALFNASLGNEIFGNILDDLVITWHNF